MSNSVSETPIFDLILVQGANFQLDLTLKDENKDPIPISGYTFTSKVRTDFGGDLVVEFTTAIIDALNGQLRLSLSAVQTAALDFDNNKYKYDILSDDGAGFKTKILQGAVTLDKTISI